MKRVHLVILGILAMVALNPAGALADAPPAEAVEPPTQPPSPSVLFRKISPSIVVVEALGPDGKAVSQASGVVVAQQGVATNRHVVEGATAVRVRQGARTWDAIIAHMDPQNDLCQLHVPGLTATPVMIRSSGTLEPGERVYTIGAPQGLELTVAEGIVSGLREYEGIRLIQTTAPISAGSSGGGLFDVQGRLVGLTTFLVKGGQNLNFAYPAELVAALPRYPSKLPLRSQSHSSLKMRSAPS